MSSPISRVQQEILRDYATEVGLDPGAAYLSGAPLRPLPPLDVGTDSVMVIGAYPSARFAAMDGQRDVPVGDNLGPFEPERYFDGQRVRTQASADELNALFFNRLELDRAKCWVTDLVKVFLFKPGHRAKYQCLGAVPPTGYERERFEELAERSLPWLEREIEVAAPRLVVTLGSEVAGIVRGIRGQRARNDLLSGAVSELVVGQRAVQAVHLAHPGILMRRGDNTRNPWPARHDLHLQALREHLPHGAVRQSC